MEPLVCAGSPRDLGWDQGRACRALLRARFGGRWPRLPARVRPARLRRVLEDLRRHFPHQYEQLIGMARGASLSASKLQVASVSTLEAPTRAVGYRVGGRAQLAASLPGDALLRDARPEGGFAARELTRPALTSVLIAANEAGLAVAATGSTRVGRCAAPAALLLRDCVERFDRVAAATEWCLTRPSADGTALLLADAAGDLAAVEIRGGQRRTLAPVGGVLMPEGGPESAAQLAKTLAGSSAVRDRNRVLQALLGAHALADPETGALCLPQPIRALAG